MNNAPTPRRAHLAYAALLGTALALPALAADYRFPDKPFGLDTPAGRCVVCHSLEKNGPFRVAPNLYDIVGADKARVDRFNYSQALREKGGSWTEEDLDKFLENASTYAPGSTKSIRVADAEERRKIIDYLKSELAN